MRKRMAAGRHSRRRWTVRGTGVVTLALTGLLLTPGLASARPTSPSDDQISAAQQAADSAAAQQGQVAAQLANAQAAVDQARAAANVALGDYQRKQTAYESARTTAQAADAAEKKAEADLAVAKAAVAAFARDSYMSGSTSSRMTAMVTSGSPAQMLERAALLDAVGDHRSQVVDQVTVAQHQADAAATTAHTALAQAETLKQQASAALDAASAQEASVRAQAAALQTQKSQLDTQVAAAQQNLAGLQGQRAAAVAYDQQSAAPSAPAPAGPVAPVAAPTNAAQVAINAAMRWLGTMYAWGGGSLTGPSEGFYPDQGVIGFDCSGLTRYAYARAGIILPRVAADQYYALPHVSSANLQPGDLVFYGPTADLIHHVAMYIGNGQMIEAPESGEVIHITRMRWGDYYGAGRPSDL